MNKTMKKNWLARLLIPDDELTGGSLLSTSIRPPLYQPPSPEVMEKVLLTGDLASLTPPQRLSYYESVCKALNLNPLTKPFEYIMLNGKLTLYARKDCTDQLRRIYGISIRVMSRETIDGVFTVVARAEMASGRDDESIGAVFLPSSGEARANAIMKAETKAKRRVTLSICGLGMFDETEIEGAGFNDAMTPEDRVRQVTENRTAKIIEANAILPPDEDISVATGPVTEENFNEVICHIGKAEGEMFEKKVGEIHPKILAWLKNHFGDGEGTRWGNPPSKKDERLFKAVTLALAKL
jgi:hypothetical protein